MELFHLAFSCSLARGNSKVHCPFRRRQSECFLEFVRGQGNVFHDVRTLEALTHFSRFVISDSRLFDFSSGVTSRFFKPWKRSPIKSMIFF